MAVIKGELRALAGAALSEGKEIVVFGWNAKAHTLFTRSIEKGVRFVFDDPSRLEGAGLVIITKLAMKKSPEVKRDYPQVPFYGPSVHIRTVRSVLEECKGQLKLLEPPAPKPPVAAKRRQSKAPPVVQEAPAPVFDDLFVHETIREAERWRKNIIGPQLQSIEKSMRELAGKLKLKQTEATKLRRTLKQLDRLEKSARTVLELHKELKAK